jgi:glutathione synthase/RimK-type ligase-like ATP-grasp enzyme
VVVKPNSGSGGRSVFHIRDNENELVDKVSLVVNKNSYVALSPFYQYDTEYRIIMHKNQLLTVYAKERQFVIGDGETNLFSLIVNKYGSLKTELANFVPAKDEKVVIN